MEQENNKIFFPKKLIKVTDSKVKAKVKEILFPNNPDFLRLLDPIEWEIVLHHNWFYFILIDLKPAPSLEACQQFGEWISKFTFTGNNKLNKIHANCILKFRKNNFQPISQFFWPIQAETRPDEFKPLGSFDLKNVLIHNIVIRKRIEGSIFSNITFGEDKMLHYYDTTKNQYMLSWFRDNGFEHSPNNQQQQSQKEKKQRVSDNVN